MKVDKDLDRRPSMATVKVTPVEKISKTKMHIDQQDQTVSTNYNANVFPTERMIYILAIAVVTISMALIWLVYDSRWMKHERVSVIQLKHEYQANLQQLTQQLNGLKVEIDKVQETTETTIDALNQKFVTVNQLQALQKNIKADDLTVSKLIKNKKNMDQSIQKIKNKSKALEDKIARTHSQFVSYKQSSQQSNKQALKTVGEITKRISNLNKSEQALSKKYDILAKRTASLETLSTLEAEPKQPIKEITQLNLKIEKLQVQLDQVKSQAGLF